MVPAHLEKGVGVYGRREHHGYLVEELHVVAQRHVEEPRARPDQQVAHVGQRVPAWAEGGRLCYMSFTKLNKELSDHSVTRRRGHLQIT